MGASALRTSAREVEPAAREAAALENCLHRLVVRLEDGEHEGRFAEAVALRDVHVFESEKIVDRALALGAKRERERRVAFGEDEVGRPRDEDRGLEGRDVVAQKGRLHLGGFGLENVGARSRTRREGGRVHVGGRSGRERQKKRTRDIWKSKGNACEGKKSHRHLSLSSDIYDTRSVSNGDTERYYTERNSSDQDLRQMKHLGKRFYTDCVERRAYISSDDPEDDRSHQNGYHNSKEYYYCLECDYKSFCHSLTPAISIPRFSLVASALSSTRCMEPL